MQKEIKLVPCESPTVNPVLIRMNCLMLACLDDIVYPKMARAVDYYLWVMDGTNIRPDEKGP